MKLILSPAKSINFDIQPINNKNSIPVHLNDSQKLVSILKKYSAKKISDLMGVSNDIALLNYQRFQDWTIPFTEKNSKPAADIFNGPVYQGLDFLNLSIKEREKGQEIIRILSGLYGVLKPLDMIQPYRLEMGTKLKINAKTNNLYQFWGDKIADYLNEELKNDKTPFLVNLASSEYFKAAQLKKINAPIITPHFKDRNKNGEYKIIMTFAKKARGLMAKYIIQNKINKEDDLKGFNLEGYSFSKKESNNNDFVFLRD